jgi:hypothetical protein
MLHFWCYCTTYDSACLYDFLLSVVPIWRDLEAQRRGGWTVVKSVHSCVSYPDKFEGDGGKVIAGVDVFFRFFFIFVNKISK